MKKFLSLFAMLLVAASAWSLPFEPTTDPSASTTKWYQIKTGTHYMYSNHASWDDVYPSTTASTDDYYLWCFVGTSSTGYTIYNRGARAYMNGLYVSGSPGDYELSYVEMASGNNFYIYYNDRYGQVTQKMYVYYDSDNNCFSGTNGKVDTFTSIEVAIDPPTPPTELPYETLTATDYNVPHNTLENVGPEGYKKLVDQDKSTKWCVVNNSGSWETIWMDFESDVWFIPNGYILTTGNDTQTNPNRNPKEWILYGKVFKNDDWTEIAHVTNGGGLEAKNTTDYTFPLTGITQGYRYFRFEVRQINGKSTSDNNYIFQLAELQLTGTKVADPTPQGLPFVPTTDPSAWSTHWYHIKSPDVYLINNPNSNYVGASSSPSNDDNYLWCFVGTESTGYKIYNRARQCYMRGFYMNGTGDEADINYAEVESGNSFAISYNDGGKMYLVYTNGMVHGSSYKYHSYTAIEILAPLDPPEINIPGDLNGDGKVDIADVNAVINMMLGKTSPTEAGDVTGDGNVDIADVNAVINLMLGKTTPTPPPTDPTPQTLTAIGYNIPHNGLDNEGNEGYAKLVDGNRNTKWCVENRSGAWETIWIDLKSNTAFTPTSYLMTPGNDTWNFYTRNPKNWKIYGRNSESESWTQLAHVTDGSGLGTSNSTDYTFEFNGVTKAYQYYRFEVIEIGGKDKWNSAYYVFQLAELTLLGY